MPFPTTYTFNKHFSPVHVIWTASDSSLLLLLVNPRSLPELSIQVSMTVVSKGIILTTEDRSELWSYANNNDNDNDNDKDDNHNNDNYNKK